MASSNSVITHARRAGLAKITSGTISSLPKIAYIALGDGGVDNQGAVLEPDEMQTELNHEVGRYAAAPVEFPVDTTAQYRITLAETDLAGKAISEAALLDVTGVLCAIRNFSPKMKDADEEFTFVFDDEF